MNILYLCTMEETAEKTRWYDNILAALIFFTRLPFWRLHQPPQSSYKTVVEFWPLTGWLTGGAMAATLYFGSMILPHVVAVIAAIAMRLLITGALHEDGLADFLDGFGGGGNRDRILAIMKDSHIGTYGVLGLIIYLLLLGTALYSMPVTVAALTILAADPFSKMITSQLVSMLPYARREEEAKNKTVYRKPSPAAGLLMSLQGLLPMVLMFWLTGINWYLVVCLPVAVMYFLYLLIHRKIQGYTGDCCGAVCLLVELTVYLTVCSELVTNPLIINL